VGADFLGMAGDCMAGIGLTCLAPRSNNHNVAIHDNGFPVREFDIHGDFALDGFSAREPMARIANDELERLKQQVSVERLVVARAVCIK
jgi:hypothetical protein